MWDTDKGENPRIFCSIESPLAWERRIHLIPRVFQHIKPELFLTDREGRRIYIDKRLGEKICAEYEFPLSKEERESWATKNARFPLKELEKFLEEFAREYVRQWSAIAERVVATENEAQLEPQLFAFQLAWTKTMAKEKPK